MSNIHDLGSRIQKMDLYEAIFCRKSVRNYRKSPVSQETQDEILHYFYEIPEVFGEINTAVAVCDNADGSVRMHLPGEVNAPYYLVFYSEKCVNDLMNIGYLIQQMSLFLCTRGFGACNVTNLQLRKDLQKKGTLQAMGMLAFGVPAGPLTHKENEFNRLPLEKLCSYQEKPKEWTEQILRAARLAPSSGGSQPWRFVVTGEQIHVYTKKHKIDSMGRHRQESIDFGRLFANIAIAAEALWIDVDLIRLGDIGEQFYPSSRYVLSVVLKNNKDVNVEMSTDENFAGN